ncbi:unnamed protein product [Kluyveromyces dobzhanskii CBS 2104]|uniref:WGS project CCBQ000000000 data, contig 00015 n=1 Tax=Kluyveromyces dobzhanskii CBS 2104 TaxID=1427455 RepID=A0A0A8LCH0_9SACH|nr:unnamed protein product [Kluyveromyces dobzhanskii CBS 2104]
MRLVVFSGGTATNSLLECFEELSRDAKTTAEPTVTYIIPVSDNGGSTSEILRCFGGIALGDLRSRALNLFQNEPLRHFLHHRLHRDSIRAKREWESLIRGEHRWWKPISPDRSPGASAEISARASAEASALCAELQRLFHVFAAKVRDLQCHFDFAAASVGNIMLKSMEMESGIDAALHKFLQLGGVPPNYSIVPCVTLPAHLLHPLQPPCPSPTLQLQLVLANGDVITGQSEISHPADPALKSQLHFCKSSGSHAQLAAAVQQLRYVVDDRGTLSPAVPAASAAGVRAIESADFIVYSIGSVITSLMPSLIVPEIARAIAANSAATKVLLQNGTYDRESFGLDSRSYTQLVESTLRQAANVDRCDGDNGQERSVFCSHVIRLANSEIPEHVTDDQRRNGTSTSTGTGTGTVTVTIQGDADRFYDPQTLLNTLRSIP